MADQDHEAVDDDSRLPVRTGERRPEVRPAGLAPVDPVDALVRAAGAPFLAPLTAAAAVTEMMTRMMSPWLGGAQRTTTPWAGPGVHVSYTHLEVHWPLG